MSRHLYARGHWLLYRVRECIVTERRASLSVYVPAKASAQTSPQAVDDFDNSQKLYILETVARDARSKASRRVVVAMALMGFFASQWPVAFSAANAVPSLPVSAHAAGVRAPVMAAPERLAFAAGLQSL
jgi:hypothetical protein